MYNYECMTLHLDTFSSIAGIHRQRSNLKTFNMDDLRRFEPAWEHVDRGAKGGFLLNAEDRYGRPNLTALAGELLAILHCREGAPEWVQVSSDFRSGWCALPDETQQELLRAEREGRNDEDLSSLVLSAKLNRHLPQVNPALGGVSFSTVTMGAVGEKPQPILLQDMTAFLWALNTYQDERGMPLQVLPYQDRIPRFRR